MCKLTLTLNTTNFRDVLFERFMNAKFYDIGLMGRKRLNKKLRLNIPLQCTTLTPLDFLAIFYKLFSLYNNFSLIQNFFPTEGRIPINVPFLGDSFTLNAKANSWSESKSKTLSSSGSITLRELKSLNLKGSTLPNALPGIGNVFKPRHNLLDNTPLHGSLDHLNQRHIRTSGEFLFLQFWRAILRFYQVLSQLSSRSNFIKSSYTAAGKTGRNFFSLSNISLFPSTESNITNQTEYMLPISNNQTHVLKAYGYLNMTSSNDDAFNFNLYQYQCFQNTMAGEFVVKPRVSFQSNQSDKVEATSNKTTLNSNKITGLYPNNFRREILNIVINRNDLNSILPYTPYLQTQKTLSTCAQFQNFTSLYERDFAYTQDYKIVSPPTLFTEDLVMQRDKVNNQNYRFSPLFRMEQNNRQSQISYQNLVLDGQISGQLKPVKYFGLAKPWGKIWWGKQNMRNNRLKHGEGFILMTPSYLIKRRHSRTELSTYQGKKRRGTTSLVFRRANGWPNKVGEEKIKHQKTDSGSACRTSPSKAMGWDPSEIRINRNFNKPQLDKNSKLLFNFDFQNNDLWSVDDYNQFLKLSQSFYFKQNYKMEPNQNSKMLVSQPFYRQTFSTNRNPNKHNTLIKTRRWLGSKSEREKLFRIQRLKRRILVNSPTAKYGLARSVERWPSNFPVQARVTFGLKNSVSNSIFHKMKRVFFNTPLGTTPALRSSRPLWDKENIEWNDRQSRIGVSFKKHQWTRPRSAKAERGNNLRREKTKTYLGMRWNPNLDQPKLGSKIETIIKKLLYETKELRVYDAKERMRNLETKLFNGVFKEFFNLDPLSQDLDETNGLSEIIHKRRISALGKGGVTSKNAPLSIRSIHPSFYGRLCPIDSPEGDRVGLINSLTNYARINSIGYIATPFYRTRQYDDLGSDTAVLSFNKKGVAQGHQKFLFNLNPLLTKKSTLQMRLCPPISFFGKIYNSYDIFPSLRLSFQDISYNLGKIKFGDFNKEWKILNQNSDKQVILQIGSTQFERTYKYFMKSSYLRPNPIKSLSPEVSLLGKKSITGNPFIYRSKQNHFKFTKIHDFGKGLEPLPSFGLSKSQQRGLVYDSFMVLPYLVGEKKSFQNSFQINSSKGGTNFDSSSIAYKDKHTRSSKLELFLFYDTHYMTPPITHHESIINNAKPKDNTHVDTPFLTSYFDFISFQGYAPITAFQFFSPGVGLIPFLEHDDGTRALMGANMQRQAVPLISASRPIVGTGLEKNVAASFIISSSNSGYLYYISGKQSKQIFTAFGSSVYSFNKLRLRLSFHSKRSDGVNPNCFKSRLATGYSPYRSTLMSIASSHLVSFIGFPWRKYSADKRQVKPHRDLLNRSLGKTPMGATPLVFRRADGWPNKVDGKLVSCNKLVKETQFLNQLSLKNQSPLKKKGNEQVVSIKKPVWTSENYTCLQAKYYAELTRHSIWPSGFLKRNPDTALPVAKRCGETQMKTVFFPSKKEYTHLEAMYEAMKNYPYLVGRFKQAKAKNTYRSLSYNFKNDHHFILNTHWLPYRKSYKATIINKKPAIESNSWLQKGDLLVDGTSSINGELALGRNLFSIYMPWEGYNFEDAILISDKAAQSYTTIHVEEFSVKISKNEFVSSIVKPFTWVNLGDILVSKKRKLENEFIMNRLLFGMSSKPKLKNLSVGQRDNNSVFDGESNYSFYGNKSFLNLKPVSLQIPFETNSLLDQTKFKKQWNGTHSRLIENKKKSSGLKVSMPLRNQILFKQSRRRKVFQHGGVNYLETDLFLSPWRNKFWSNYYRHIQNCTRPVTIINESNKENWSQAPPVVSHLAKRWSEPQNDNFQLASYFYDRSQFHNQIVNKCYFNIGAPLINFKTCVQETGSGSDCRFTVREAMGEYSKNYNSINQIIPFGFFKTTVEAASVLIHSTQMGQSPALFSRPEVMAWKPNNLLKFRPRLLFHSTPTVQKRGDIISDESVYDEGNYQTGTVYHKVNMSKSQLAFPFQKQHESSSIFSTEEKIYTNNPYFLFLPPLFHICYSYEFPLTKSWLYNATSSFIELHSKKKIVTNCFSGHKKNNSGRFLANSKDYYFLQNLNELDSPFSKVTISGETSYITEQAFKTSSTTGSSPYRSTFMSAATSSDKRQARPNKVGGDETNVDTGIMFDNKASSLVRMNEKDLKLNGTQSSIGGPVKKNDNFEIDTSYRTGESICGWVIAVKSQSQSQQSSFSNPENKDRVRILDPKTRMLEQTHSKDFIDTSTLPKSVESHPSASPIASRQAEPDQSMNVLNHLKHKSSKTQNESFNTINTELKTWSALKPVRGIYPGSIKKFLSLLSIFSKNVQFGSQPYDLPYEVGHFPIPSLSLKRQAGPHPPTLRSTTPPNFSRAGGWPDGVKRQVMSPSEPVSLKKIKQWPLTPIGYLLLKSTLKTLSFSWKSTKKPNNIHLKWLVNNSNIQFLKKLSFRPPYCSNFKDKSSVLGVNTPYTIPRVKTERTQALPVVSSQAKRWDENTLKVTKNLKPRPGSDTIYIYVAVAKPLQVGDKMSGRHGNKGIISKILPFYDMPYLIDGTPIDIVLNPLGVPSRMNVGQIYESLLGLTGFYKQEYYRIPPFDENYSFQFSRNFVYWKLNELKNLHFFTPQMSTLSYRPKEMDCLAGKKSDQIKPAKRFGFDKKSLFQAKNVFYSKTSLPVVVSQRNNDVASFLSKVHRVFAHRYFYNKHLCGFVYGFIPCFFYTLFVDKTCETMRWNPYLVRINLKITKYIRTKLSRCTTVSFSGEFFNHGLNSLWHCQKCSIWGSLKTGLPINWNTSLLGCSKSKILDSVNYFSKSKCFNIISNKNTVYSVRSSFKENWFFNYKYIQAKPFSLLKPSISYLSFSTPKHNLNTLFINQNRPAIEKFGLNPYFPGKMRLLNGLTGETFYRPIIVGKSYMLKLIHLVHHKIHARATGPYALITQQPLKGKRNQGGQRMGEMEIWALYGFGSASILYEMLTIKSDDPVGRERILRDIAGLKGNNSSNSNWKTNENSNALSLREPISSWKNEESGFGSKVNDSLEKGISESFRVLVMNLRALCLDMQVFKDLPN